MAELLDRIRADIRERMEASRAAVEEYELLQAALAALGGPGPASGRSTVKPMAKRAAPKRPVRGVARASGASRASRGANREAVLRVLGERPGVGVSELAEASGVKRTVLYALLARLVESGEVVKEALPGGSTGYSLLRDVPTTSSTGADAASESPPSVPGVGATAPGAAGE